MSPFKHALVTAALLTVMLSVPLKAGLPGWGTNDFIQYWAAYRLFIEGANPYDPTAMLTVQRSVGWTGTSPQMMWNPPWLLILMSPVLQFGFVTAAKCWMAVNVLLVAVLALLSTLLIVPPGKRTSLHFIAAAFLFTIFYPTYSCIQLGQIGLLLSAAAALLACSLVIESQILAACALVVLTCKPHLYYLVFSVLLWWIVRRRWLSLPIYFALGAGCLALLTEFAAANSIKDWLWALNGATGATSISEWKAATLSHFLYSTLFDHGVRLPPGAIMTLPAVCAASVFSWLVAAHPAINWRTAFLPLAAASLATAPYGWIFDEPILAGLSLALMVLGQPLPSAPRRMVYLTLGVVHALAFAAATWWITTHDQFFWYAPSMLLVYAVLLWKIRPLND